MKNAMQLKAILKNMAEAKEYFCTARFAELYA